VRLFHFHHGNNGRTPEGQRIEIRGTVQGVGFRPWVYRVAQESHVTGRVRNHTGGVTIEAFGEHDAMRAFITRLAKQAPAAARIAGVAVEPIPYEPAAAFEIVESDGAPKGERRGERHVSIPPDLSTCSDCLAELRDPADRRFRYPFVNCTVCGPRFTIATAAPYDRSNTTMAPFEMCDGCRREYERPEDRRFHAQPNACPSCGPVLTAVDPELGRIESGNAVEEAARALNSGGIVALKGVGGFQLACDATSATAVERLRLRKRRDEKPFAVMVSDVIQARRIAVLGPEDERLLMSAERPIVLVRRREPSQLPPVLAPNNPLVGLMLPYSPVHHLLLDRAGGPLVMTSGNISEEPIAYLNSDALQRLGTIADLFLVHEREIATRCDDSVARVIAGAPMVLRRARGYVPRPIVLGRPLQRSVLACGALLKNTFCLARGDEACLGPHIGDLENLETFRSYRESIARLEQFIGFAPDIVAHDLHPEYLSTQYALARPAATHIGVQHHHAHVAAVMAEHGLDGPVIGVAYDGVGLGTDGAAWGGEILIADYTRFTREATFRPIALAGGDAAIREPWRASLALLEDVFGGDAPLDALRLFDVVPPTQVDLVRTMLRQGVNVTAAHGVDRYFDALGALALRRPRAAYEGQIALEWEVAAAPNEGGRYRHDVNRSSQPWELDLRHAMRQAVFELIGGEAPELISARFHNTLAAATADLVRAVSRTQGRLPVVLSGGCFRNARLAESVVKELTPEFSVYLPSQAPPGDGGIALGQAVIADALVSRGAR
jgi:hydrogenase maturation protein HypF